MPTHKRPHTRSAKGSCGRGFGRRIVALWPLPSPWFLEQRRRLSGASRAQLRESLRGAPYLVACAAGPMHGRRICLGCAAAQAAHHPTGNVLPPAAVIRLRRLTSADQLWEPDPAVLATVVPRASSVAPSMLCKNAKLRLCFATFERRGARVPIDFALYER